MSALYRVVIQGWTKQAAVEEMTKGGFGFHEVWVNLVPWFNGLDMERIRAASEIAGRESERPPS